MVYTFFKCSGSITGGVGESGGCGLAGTLVIRFNLTGLPAEKHNVAYISEVTMLCVYRLQIRHGHAHASLNQ